MRIDPNRVKAVQTQAQDLMASAAAVKGSDYAALMKVALMAMSLTQTFRLALESDMVARGPKGADLLIDIFSDTLASLMNELVILTGVPEDVVAEAFQEAMQVNEKVTALMGKAVTSKDFG